MGESSGAQSIMGHYCGHLEGSAGERHMRSCKDLIKIWNWAITVIVRQSPTGKYEVGGGRGRTSH